MPLRADPSRRSRRIGGPHRVLAGVLPQRAFCTLPQRYTWTPRNTSGEMACDAENGRQGEGGEYPGWQGRAEGRHGMGEDMGTSHRKRRYSPCIRGTWVGSLPLLFALVCHASSPHRLTNRRKNDVHTIITLTDNAPQGLNDSLSSFPLATKVGPSFHKPFTLSGMIVSFRS
jgi:hypothetical protein